MSPDISLLPDDLRRQEEELKGKPKATSHEEVLPMHIPSPESEDIEVIEVDEGEVGDVLSTEPWLSRVVFGAQSFIQKLRVSLFQPRREQPPPKLPPQFFKPPSKAKAPGLVPIAGAEPVNRPAPAEEKPAGVAAPVMKAASPVSEAPKPKARVMPAAEVARRVRVIKRVRKPVRVSFLDEAEWQMMADVPRRKFTLIFTFVVFVILIGGGYYLLQQQGQRSLANLAEVQTRLSDVQGEIAERQTQWSNYRDLEPRLKQLGTLLDAHVAPTALFDALERATVPSVFYSGMSMAPTGAVTLSATAPNFDDAARQVVALRAAGFAKSVDAYGYHADYAGNSNVLQRVTFQMTLTLNRSFLNAMTRVAQAPTSP